MKKDLSLISRNRPVESFFISLTYAYKTSKFIPGFGSQAILRIKDPITLPKLR